MMQECDLILRPPQTTVGNTSSRRQTKMPLQDDYPLCAVEKDLNNSRGVYKHI